MFLEINQNPESQVSFLQSGFLQQNWQWILGTFVCIFVIWRLFTRKVKRVNKSSNLDISSKGINYSSSKTSITSEQAETTGYINVDEDDKDEYTEYQNYLESKQKIHDDTTGNKSGNPSKSADQHPSPNEVSDKSKQNEPEVAKKVLVQDLNPERTTQQVRTAVIETTTIVSQPTLEYAGFHFIGYDPRRLQGHVQQLDFPYLVLPEPNSIITIPRKGRIGRQGYKDADFHKYLSTTFGQNFEVDDSMQISVNSRAIYSPDIAVIDTTDTLNLFIDIEIDEPYEGTNDVEKRKAIHYQGSDDVRDSIYSNNGWIVIRFAEIQVHQNPTGCCRYIADLISKIKPEFVIPDSLKNAGAIRLIQRWTKEEAEIFSKNRKREKYLGIDSFGVVPETKVVFVTKPTEEVKLIETVPNFPSSKRELQPDKTVASTPINALTIKHTTLPVLVPYKIKDEWSIYDLNDKKLLNERFEECYLLDDTFHYSRSCVVVKGNKYAIVTSLRQAQNCVWYDSLKHTKVLNYLIVKINSKYGIVSDLNEVLLQPVYDNAEEIARGVVKISGGGRVGVFDTYSKSVAVPLAYDDVLSLNESVAVVKINDKLRLFDVDIKKFIDNELLRYKHIDVFQNGYSLCYRDDRYFLLYKNGTEYEFPACKYKMVRSGNIIWTLTESYDINIFCERELRCTITDKVVDRIPSIKVIYDKYIDIGSHSMKYNHTTRIAVFDIDGNKLTESEIIRLDNRIKLEKESKLISTLLKDTLWTIEGNRLYYGKELKYTAPIEIENHEFLDLSKFYCGFALLSIIWDVDPEFGVRSENVGYIDTSGNKYWKD